MTDATLGTGLPGLDKVFKGLLPGDNVVWQVDSVEEYRPFVPPYVEKAINGGRRLVYFRFAKHAPLIEIPEAESPVAASATKSARLAAQASFQGVEVHVLHPEAGLETFISETHAVIERYGSGAWYVFDLLSELADQWYSDQMLGNFFLLTCPYLYDVGAIAYFALLRGCHADDALSAITETAQLTIDVFRHAGKIYVHPLKVQQRYSPTMHILHVWRQPTDDKGQEPRTSEAGGEFVPVANSATISEIRTSVSWGGLDGTYPAGLWNRASLEAEEALPATSEERSDLGPRDASARVERGKAKHEDLLERLLRMTVSRDERVLALARKYLTVTDIAAVRRRVIGTGLIGGKSVGMLLAGAILRKSEARWGEILECHDSFFAGSDVFYTYVVRNGLWWVREKQKDKAAFLEGAERARQRMLVGDFAPHIVKQFADMLDYFGQAPIIVRSSSLLEDNFGNSFAGQYESVFCANQGSRHKRLEDFLSAVRSIYASTMSERALSYRAQRGLLECDEQMALLVQRVSGCMYGHLFYPHVAGVALSYNPYVWSSYIKPEDGVVRLVFGLGTRAVDRCDDDYTRVVALGAPERRVESSVDEVREHAQRRVDIIDLNANQLVSLDFREVAAPSAGLPIEIFASRDAALDQQAAQAGQSAVFPWVLTFERLLTETPLVGYMRDILRVLESAYEYPVDVEFTANLTEEGKCRVNVVQCRPLQVKGGGTVLAPPASIPPEDLVLKTHGAVIGHSRLESVDRLVYVVPSLYGQLPLQKRYAVARLVGRVLHANEARKPKFILLVGPGRWGTTTPALGVPVNFSEINTITALCEVAAMHEGLVPDVSLGTHFFNELVEMDILYLALVPSREGNLLNGEFLSRAPNRLAELVPGGADMADIVRVIDPASLPGAPALRLHADLLKQQVLCYLDGNERAADGTVAQGG
ncbi:MAG: pyruvate, phosphate dikinase [Planctomycetota bacterium]|nr:pyruvate, phosphate dikinase [Planctomycetota bacterium]